ncbi:putative methylaconitate Delta-isomerase PrpF (plasmid) [Burkholderia sp. SFA1]|uniref:2-methylaconitate cis-trans isomerase PrpF n=1 Tax=unclassified Caballeronia TaxID=2646786 RepID=UPI001F244960|nr:MULTISPECIES: 2-methylaconitate cis-trans isomerase PrpF [unclassified Caballeronia]MCE4546004.1 2-methylaconitate cis-trans isomerase PrpF [Caballeronia sp. PC1]MCE4571874.1 2-methylaconitate cis-trans isomerase PrpF [Caballeronia sp. CLC5]BBQ01357.1 putative methylaconitate Delta-isomerase PrpF [Burkholderia sp. SFA1]
MSQSKIQAVYMRGGTSKGVFFRDDWLPADPAVRDRILMRVIGSPDPYGQHIDGMGGATSSTSKVVIVGPSSREDCDVDYRFGQVAIDKPVVDWSGNCGNLTAAVGPFAIAQGLVDAPRDGVAIVRIWQANIGAKIIAHVPMKSGEVVEEGDFELDGVTFPAAEIRIEFLDPGGDGDDAGGAMFPTGNAIDVLDVPGVGPIEMTMINAGNPAIFIDAASLGLHGSELQRDVNGDSALLQKAEAIRSHASVRMGLAATAEDATRLRPHTPKLAFVSKPASYVASSGKAIEASTLDINARIFSMGKLHHAMTGTGAVAIAVAAVIPGTVVNRLVAESKGSVCFGHPSGSLQVGAEAEMRDGVWMVTKAVMSRSARRLMEGFVLVPSSVMSG